ncbi:hypothetical protein EJD97_024521 [Solanum chilense]|uniref:Integrase zinc-binding domain-containing protein n=1 Tax=Solanum chilense TaxID=4083 RepID=A0A6N2ASG5_SOLCI|nr:hypothetical protein EJD97_024521 [Solanum chilense]
MVRRVCDGPSCRFSMGSTAHVDEEKRELAKDVHKLALLGVKLMDSTKGRTASVHNQRVLTFEQGGDGILKMYHNLREVHWWEGMKKDISKFFAKCQNCKQVNLSTTLYPHTDGQAKCAIQMLEDMCIAFLIDFKGSWDDHVPLIEKVKVIQELLKTTQICQKSCTVVRRRPLEFTVDDWVYLKDNLSCEEFQVSIFTRQVRKLRTKEVASFKVLWRNQFVKEATSEADEDMMKRYPHLFESGENAE